MAYPLSGTLLRQEKELSLYATKWMTLESIMVVKETRKEKSEVQLIDFQNKMEALLLFFKGSFKRIGYLKMKN